MVAWNKVCSAKKSGGLGIRDVYEWNKAAVGKYIWAIARKKDTLFVKWINSVYLEGKEWWDYELPADSSWVWRKLVNLKNSFKEKVAKQEFIQEVYSLKRGHKILFGQGQSKFSWADRVWERLNNQSTESLFG